MPRKYEQLEFRLTPSDNGYKMEYIHHGRRKKTYLSRSHVANRNKDVIRQQHEQDFKEVRPKLRLPGGVNE